MASTGSSVDVAGKLALKYCPAETVPNIMAGGILLEKQGFEDAFMDILSELSAVQIVHPVSSAGASAPVCSSL